MRNISLASAGVLLLAGASEARALSLSLVASGFTQPVALMAPSGDDRLFVVERGGKIRIIRNGVVEPTPFLDLTAVVNSSANSEVGLLGMAFAPDFSTSGNFYVSYNSRTAPFANSLQIWRHNAATGSNVASPTGQLVVDTFTSSPPFHISGWIGFRPGEPNNLYLTMGDLNSSSTVQNPDSQAGKIWRMNVSGPGAASPAAGNPFLGNSSSADDFVYGLGLRSPWRNSFDPVTGDFYISDVGQDAFEEINIAQPGEAGLNFGWPHREGPNPLAPGGTGPFRDPDFFYAQDSGGLSQPGFSASVTGGAVYRGSRLPSLYGKYVFGDFTNATFASFRYNPANRSISEFELLTDALNPGRSVISRFNLVAFGTGGDGELYTVSYNTGRIHMVIPEPGMLGLLMSAAPLLLRRRGR
jgi:glucose/arabinose dehydrogenase